MKHVVGLILLIGYIMGIVLAKGFWSTLFAIIIPLWGYYLVVEALTYKFLGL
jgi:hypothetical protein